MTENNFPLFAEAANDMKSHSAEEALAEYIDALAAGMNGTLPGDLVAHVENCRQCQVQILDVLFYLRDPSPPAGAVSLQGLFPARKRRVAWLPLPFRIAAASFVFILLLTAYFSLPRHRVPDPGATGTAKALSPLERAVPSLTVPAAGPAREPGRGKAVRPSATVAKKGNGRPAEGRDAFAINPNLESMVGSRSRGLAIEVYSPPNHITFAQEILFNWKEFSREPLNLAIVNNRNETLFKNPVSGGRFLFRAALPSGCYYWKLESASDLYYVGKFFVAADPTSPKE